MGKKRKYKLVTLPILPILFPRVLFFFLLFLESGQSGPYCLHALFLYYLICANLFYTLTHSKKKFVASAQNQAKQRLNSLLTLPVLPTRPGSGALDCPSCFKQCLLVASSTAAMSSTVMLLMFCVMVGLSWLSIWWTPCRVFRPFIHLDIWIDLCPSAAATAPPPPLALLDNHFAEFAFGANERAAWVEYGEYCDSEEHGKCLESIYE